MIKSSILLARQFQMSGKPWRIFIHAINPIAHQVLSKHLSYWKQKDSLQGHWVDNVQIVQGDVRDFIAGADVIVSKSGTVSLECALIKRPMVVINRLDFLNYFLATKVLRLQNSIPFIAMINYLAGRRRVVPEFLQGEATPEAIVRQTFLLLHNKALQRKQISEFTIVHNRLLTEKVDPSEVISKFLGKGD